MQHTVRSARLSDAPRIRELLAQLGYSADLTFVEQRLEAVAESATDSVLVAEAGESVIGVVSLHSFDLFHQSGRIGRITSFVVDDSMRGSGVGKLLLAATDAFFRSAGCVRAEVTSGNHRANAHAFYESSGYLPDERRFLKRYDASG
jgi:N-acetylglutamate synthase-like GNAT family acetyltransferase